MKIWIGYHCYDTGSEVLRTVEKVFDDEVKAQLWVDDPEFNENAETYLGHKIVWREHEEREVE
jgi:hypothetical protein